MIPAALSIVRVVFLCEEFAFHAPSFTILFINSYECFSSFFFFSNLKKEKLFKKDIPFYIIIAFNALSCYTFFRYEGQIELFDALLVCSFLLFISLSLSSTGEENKQLRETNRETNG